MSIFILLKFVNKAARTLRNRGVNNDIGNYCVIGVSQLFYEMNTKVQFVP